MKNNKQSFLIIIMILLCTCSINAQDMKLEKTVAISAFVARGELDKLKIELNEGLNAGLTVNEIKEMITQSYAYCGFPRAIRGLQTFMLVLDKRRADGIIDNQGQEASPITDSRPKYERGKEILAKLSGTPIPEGKPTSGYGAFSPEIDTFLKEHLFADIFERDVLTYTQREMVTVSILMCLDGVEPMLKSHMNLALNVGVTPNQLEIIVQVIKNKIGKKNADIAKSVLVEVLNNYEKDKINFNSNSYGNKYYFFSTNPIFQSIWFGLRKCDYSEFIRKGQYSSCNL